MTHDAPPPASNPVPEDAHDPPPIPGELLDMIERVRFELSQTLDALVAEVSAARTIPLSNSIVVGRDEFLSRLQTARGHLVETMGRVLEDLPEELRAARWMVRERERYVARPNEKAKDLISKAKRRSDELISESYIVEEAVAEANALVRNAENEARRIRLEAEDMAEGRLTEAETVLGELLQDVRSARSQLHETLPAGPDGPL